MKPPSIDNLDELAVQSFGNLPVALSPYKQSTLNVVDFPVDKLVDSLGLDSPYELLAMYDNGTLYLYRRPILDMWCETEQPLETLLYEVIVSELGQHAQLSDEEIAVLCERGL